jgi:hypothetical protein
MMEVVMYPNNFARAQARIATVNNRFQLASEGSRASSGHVRHKCFVSYHAADTEEAADFVESFESVFIPRAIGVEEDDGSIIDSENVDYIRDVIRRDYLRDSTVTIVLVGRCTWARKFVDWEIYASLRDTKYNRKNGLIGLLLPSATDDIPKPPERLSDNVPSNGSEAYGRYFYYPKSDSDLRANIEDAFQARTTRAHLIDNSKPLRRRNAPC